MSKPPTGLESRTADWSHLGHPARLLRCLEDYEQYIKSEGKDAADGMKGFVDKYAKDYEQFLKDGVAWARCRHRNSPQRARAPRGRGMEFEGPSIVEQTLIPDTTQSGTGMC